MCNYELAVVFTCHNRKEKTKKCLDSLYSCFDKEKTNKKSIVIICDDGSDDGTEEMILSYKDKMNIDLIVGDGDLFWARGMAKAMETAEKNDPAFYLMINDDVEFYSDMVGIMMKNYAKHNETMCAIVGCTQNRNKTECSYGGFGWDSKGLIIQKNYRRLLPENFNEICKWANWNCFLIPRELYAKIGKIDDYYEHSFADYDYSNRIIKNGYSMYVADEYVGICDRNPKEGTYLDNSISLVQRFKLLHKRTARPAKSCWYYAKKFYGVFAIKAFLEPYVYILVTSSPIYKWIRRA